MSIKVAELVGLNEGFNCNVCNGKNDMRVIDFVSVRIFICKECRKKLKERI